MIYAVRRWKAPRASRMTLQVVSKRQEPDGAMRETPDNSELGGMETPSDAAEYIGALSEELAQMARRHGLDSLGYILDMARMEADQIAKGSGDAIRPT